MARYVTTVRTQLTPEETFHYMADLRNFAEWDPGVKKVVQIVGVGGSADSEYDVSVSGKTLRYRTKLYNPTTELLVVARSSMFTSTDRVTIVPEAIGDGKGNGKGNGKGTLVTYDATLQLHGVLRLGDPLLRLAFTRIGDRAAAGLRRVLDGVDVPS